MKCVFCPTGESRLGVSSVTLERAGTTMVFKAVPGEVYDTCGEAYYTEDVTDLLLKQAECAYQEGIAVEVRSYRKAA